MCAVSISGTCGWFLRSYMRSYMFTHMLRIFFSKSERVGCDVVVLWIFLWYFSGFLLDFCLLWNDMIVYVIAYHFITRMIKKNLEKNKQIGLSGTYTGQGPKVSINIHVACRGQNTAPHCKLLIYMCVYAFVQHAKSVIKW